MAFLGNLNFTCDDEGGFFFKYFFGIVASSMFIFIMNLNISKSKMKLILHIILFKRAAAAMP